MRGIGLTAMEKRILKKGPKLVAIGGGTGLPVLLRGLKVYTSNITAIVSAADDGGSSGRLRGQFGILPPGDLRNCLLALADTEPVMEELLNYRFTQGKELAGHNLGNLFITAMADLYGSFEGGLHEISKVLAIRGRVVPSTFDNIVLQAELEDGTIVYGESLISKSTKRIKRVQAHPNSCLPAPDALEAIKEADAVILGPGSLYTSVIPNLLVPGLVETIQEAPGIKIYICNVMTQPGETSDYSASDHLKALYQHASSGLVDYIVVADGDIPLSYMEKYAQEGSRKVMIDRDKLEKMGVKIISDSLIKKNDYIRHDSEKLARLILNLVMQD